jgi:hypothetical protein
MNIGLVSNWDQQACGVANFGRDWKWALERAGHAVATRLWDEPIYPEDELLLYNWHPFIWNPLTPPMRPYGVYMHDIPPWSECPLKDQALVVWTSEPCPGCVEIPYPVYDGPWTRPVAPGRITIGWTGIRGDGAASIREACDRLGLRYDGSVGWLDTPEEVARLAGSTLIVLWYYASGRGQSLALSASAAAGVPILVNQSKMFRMAHFHDSGVLRAGWELAVPHLEPAIEGALDLIAKRRCPIPNLKARYGWTQAVARMEETWMRAWKPSLS